MEHSGPERVRKSLYSTTVHQKQGWPHTFEGGGQSIGRLGVNTVKILNFEKGGGSMTPVA